jgi:ubiquitin-small subunit ribosomal protein S27Ae
MSKKVEKKDEKAPAAAKATAPAKTEEPKKEEAKPQKPVAAPKPEKKVKKEEKGMHAMYKIEGDKVARLRPTCERCGPGYFMADHHDRFTCGHCGFTRYKRA